ncbi:hypothetical protein OIV83_002275 [Microbotryomycetes sp. JL201]|nr:hypothetical protein OIV83_002275 [Microbotryomycetes sp. JL201]
MSSAASVSSGASTIKRKRFAAVRNSLSFKRTSSVVIPEFREEEEEEPTVVAKPRMVVRPSFCSENIAPAAVNNQRSTSNTNVRSLKLKLDVPDDAFRDAIESGLQTTPSPTGTLFISLDGPATVLLDEDQGALGFFPTNISSKRDCYLPGDDDSLVDEDIIETPAVAQGTRSAASPLGSPFAVELSEFPLPPFRFEQDRLASVRSSTRTPTPSRSVPVRRQFNCGQKRFSTSGSALEWTHATLESLAATSFSSDPSCSSSRITLETHPEMYDSPPVTPALSSCSTFSSPASLRELTQTPTSYRRPDESLYTVEEDEHDVLKQDIGSVMSQVDRLLADLDDAKLEWQSEVLLEEASGPNTVCLRG